MTQRRRGWDGVDVALAFALGAVLMLSGPAYYTKLRGRWASKPPYEERQPYAELRLHFTARQEQELWDDIVAHLRESG